MFQVFQILRINVTSKLPLTMKAFLIQKYTDLQLQAYVLTEKFIFRTFSQTCTLRKIKNDNNK